MQGIAEFYKVSFNQFLEDCKTCGFADNSSPIELIKATWQAIKIPKRATGGSSGYDFFLPFPFCLTKTGSVTIPTGIRAEIQPGWCLILAPRSGLGSKYGLKLTNTVGVVDSDYSFADNEGHILVKLTTDVNISLLDGDRFIQGIFIPHGVTRNDTVEGIRNGGFGSTGVD